MKYILYARKSTEEDDRQVLSIEAQLVELQEYAAKEKLEIVASLCEAKTAKEPGEKHRLEPYFNFGGRKFFNHMNQKGFVNIVLIILVVVILAGVAGYFALNRQPASDLNAPCQSSRFCKDSSFVSSGYGWVTGCVNVLLAGGTGREQARLLLQQLNLKEPAALSEAVKPYGAFVPTLEIIVGDFNQTATLLKKDSNIIDVRLNYHSTNPSTDPNASYFVYVLFADSMTPSQGYKLLTDTYKLRVNGNINSIIPDGVPLRLEVSPGSENSTVRALRMSPIVQFALQCPVSPPARPN